MTRVLYVTHTPEVGGGERSLLDLLSLLPNGVDPVVACPPGPFADRVRAAGHDFVSIPAVGGLGRGRLLVALELVRCALAVRRRFAQFGADVVHAASVRAGVAAAIARVPYVVDVRDSLGSSGAAGAAQRLLARSATAIFANSGFTAAQFEAATGATPRIVHPLVDLRPFLGLTRARNGSTATLAVVGQLTPWKAQDDAIRAVSRVADATLLVVGDAVFTDGTLHDNARYETALRELARPLGERVRFVGSSERVADVLDTVDVLLVPSWEEPFGRVVLEGMAAGLPVIATAVGGPAEMIHDGVDGILLPPRSPERWATEIAALLEDADRRRRIGSAARERAAEFHADRARRAQRVVETYRTSRGAVASREALARV